MSEQELTGVFAILAEIDEKKASKPDPDFVWTEQDEYFVKSMFDGLHLTQELRTGDLDDDDMEWIRAETVIDKMRNGRGHYSEALFKQLEDELTAEEMDAAYRHRLRARGTIRYRSGLFEPYVKEVASWENVEKLMRMRALEYKGSSCRKDREWAAYYLSKHATGDVDAQPTTDGKPA